MVVVDDSVVGVLESTAGRLLSAVQFRGTLDVVLTENLFSPKRLSWSGVCVCPEGGQACSKLGRFSDDHNRVSDFEKPQPSESKSLVAFCT